MVISYNPTGGTYTLATANATQTFGAANRVGTQNGSALYSRTSGSTTDTLILTPNGLAAAPLTYRYVGGGYWQRTVTGATSATGTITAFAYGIATPGAAVPRTGRAGFTTELVGALADRSESQPLSMSGTGGTLVTDFATGSIDLQGRFLLFRPDGSRYGSGDFDGSYFGTGMLSASVNSFSGAFQANTLGGPYSGGFEGRFFGPEAREIGLAFQGRAGSDNVLTGTILGRYDATIDTGTRLADLTAPTTFRSGLAASLYRDSGAGLELVERAGSFYVDTLTYTPASRTYEFLNTSTSFDYYGSGPILIGQGDRLASQPSADFTAYQKMSGSDTIAVRVFEGPVAGVRLTYTSFAEIIRTQDATMNAGASKFFAYVPFGIPTPTSRTPVGGTATYTGTLYGDANFFASPIAGRSQLRWLLTGTSQFNVDFSAFSVTGTLNPIGTSVVDGTSRDFGPFAFSGIIDRSLGGFRGFFNGSGSNELMALFFGPSAEEFGGTFYIRTNDGSAELRGVTVGRRN